MMIKFNKPPFNKAILAISTFALISVFSLNANAQNTTLPKLNRATYDFKAWAKDTKGGQNGRIIRVTNLNGEGAGSLREAIEAQGPRIVVFEVGGIIDLGGKNLSIKNPFITIAGQTAPGPGITIIKGETNASNTHDVIIQHIMFRSGDLNRPVKSGNDMDSFSSVGSYNIIVDHCSFSWGTDENLSASGKRFKGKDVNEWRQNTSHNITYSNNLIFEGLANSLHPKGEHSKGGLFHDNATGILLYGNVYASNMERNALFKGGVHAAQINNIIYNPGQKAIHYNLIAHEWENVPYQTGNITLMGNVYRQGPNTTKDLPLFTIGGAGDVSLFLKDNIAQDANGKPVAQTGKYTAGNAKIIPTKTPYITQDVKIIPANKLEDQIYFSVGARPWARDPIDFKILSDVAEGRGEIINTQEQNYIGYPKYAPISKAFDESQWNLLDMSPKAGWQSLFPTKGAEH
jgi:hypothetical protein